MCQNEAGNGATAVFYFRLAAAATSSKNKFSQLCSSFLLLIIYVTLPLRISPISVNNSENLTTWGQLRVVRRQHSDNNNKNNLDSRIRTLLNKHDVGYFVKYCNRVIASRSVEIRTA